jgi:RHS repeat-associated protein
LIAILVLLLAVTLGLTYGARHARGEGEVTADAGSPVPTALALREAAEDPSAFPGPEAAPNISAANELPHRDLDREEAGELFQEVFGRQVEQTAVPFANMQVEKFLSEDTAVVESGEATGGISGNDLLVASFPLRAENEEGIKAPIDLGLEHEASTIKPANPLAEVEIPKELGKGISLPETGIGIRLRGVDETQTPTTFQEVLAFYPNVDKDTDLGIMPTPTGVETFEQLRSPEAPSTQTFEFELPTGAELTMEASGAVEAQSSDGHSLLQMLPPSATDAAGESVPVEVSADGTKVIITTRPTPGTAYPILVDPTFILAQEYVWRRSTATWEEWSTAGLNDWQSSTTAPAYAAYKEFLTPWENKKWPGLDLIDGATGSSVPAGAQGYWNIFVPRYSETPKPTSYIQKLWIGEVFFQTNGNHSADPHFLQGLWNEEKGNWRSVQSFSGASGDVAGGAYWFLNEAPWEIGVKTAGLNLSNAAYEPVATPRAAYVGQAAVYFADYDLPYWGSIGIPAWTNSAPVALPINASDSGLGVQRIYLTEVKANAGWQPLGQVVNLTCTGAISNPCPRTYNGLETKYGQALLNPAGLEQGIDYVKAIAVDAVGNLSTVTEVPVRIDRTPPELSLSGQLTEQERLGTLQPEYPLTIEAKDGGDDDPQSGIAKIEVKVDGKKVTMPTESAWNPNCSTQNCAFSGTWSLKASEYAPGSHEVEVVATDAVGLSSTTTLEVELGQEPLQTTFTSPHPTYANHEVSSIEFKATREGAPVAGATFKCSLDGSSETPTTPCTTPYKLPERLEPGWHTLLVAAVDKAGNVDPTPARWRFEDGIYPAAPANEKLVYPEAGKKTGSYYTLEAEWGSAPAKGEGVTGVTFQMKLPGSKVFEPVPAACTVNGQGQQVSWPLRARSHPGHSSPVYLNVRGCPLFAVAKYPEKELQFRAVFDGSPSVAGASEPATTEFAFRNNANRVATDATEAIGPASLDLVTGAFTMSRTDVSIPVPGRETNLEFTRVYSSTVDESLAGYSKALAGAWQPSTPLEAEFEGEAWSRIEKQVIPEKPAVYEKECWDEEGNTAPCGEGCNPEFCDEWEAEARQPPESWIELLNSEGAGIPFEIVGESYVAPDYAKELRMTSEASGERLVLSYPNGTHTTFVQGAPQVWLPKEISFQTTPSSTRMVYSMVEGKLRLTKEIAPTPPGGMPCEDSTSTTTPGCRTLLFNYRTYTKKIGGHEAIEHTFPKEELASIEYFGPSGNAAQKVTVAEYEYAVMEESAEHIHLALSSEWDPRTPALRESYTYREGRSGSGKPRDLLTSLTPPGREPWTFEYEHSGFGPDTLQSVNRAGATTTVAYNVPISGSGAPYNMSSETIAKWGQTDLPVDATAIFPPTHVPSEYPPHEYTGATVHYMDPEGHQVNTAAPAAPGVEGVSITTSETDARGNVVRELSAQNRLNALKATDTAARSRELDAHSVYNAQGTEMLESWGPLHEVRLESGETVEARQHTTIHYDEGAPAPPAGTPPAYLPTKETIAAVVPGKEGEYEPRVTETHYDWNLRKPTETIVDPGGLGIRSVTKYNALGQVEETRQPKNAAGGGAGTTRTVYYSPPTAVGGEECRSFQYVNLPCKVYPAAQAEGTGRPKLLVKTFPSYNNLDEPTEVIEESQGAGTEGTRKTITTYDSAGRQLTQQIQGGGSKVPKTETVYSPTLGLPEQQRFVCEAECGTATPKYVAAVGESGSGSGQLSGPRGVAVDGKGHFWVVDRVNNRIEEFNESGSFAETIGWGVANGESKLQICTSSCRAGISGSGNGQFASPWGIAIDSEGNLWITDTGNDRLEELNPKGEFVQKFGTKAGAGGSKGTEFVEPEGIAVAAGMLWVADGGGKRVGEFRESVTSESERFVRNVTGTIPTDPIGVALNGSGKLWVADEVGNRILEYDAEGKFLQSVGSSGSGNAQFHGPTGMAVAPSGNVLVSDVGNNRVQEFNSEGSFLAAFGSGSGGESFSEPKGVAISSGGVAFIADKNRNQIKKWTIGSGFDSQATTTTYDALGRPEKYEDADGNIARVTYDSAGRPVTTSDNKGSQTITYDPVSGVPTELKDSAAGTFTASYDADGKLLSRGLPDGLTAKSTYNLAGEPTGLSYTKTSYCGESCTWLTETVQRSISGQIVTDNGTLVNDAYSYDHAGRLTEARETPTGGSCTTRAYTYDVDSNRLSKATRAPGIGGACVTSGGTEQKYSYDEADRLIGPTYDAWGRTTSLPAEFAAGNALTTTYYGNDMVATQTQNGITNSYELDSTGRQRARLQGGGGLEGTEIFHYDGSSDSVAWTERGSTWSRSIVGFGGELAAIQEGGGSTTMQLTNLHGDVVATAELSPTATKLKATFRSDEFGNPMSGSAGRYGWLGGKQRRTELSSGVIQMGKRSYVPALGRFLTPDPVPGGSANPYDYANQDPVNAFDLEGTCSKKNTNNCLAKIRKQKKIVRRKLAHAERGAEKYLHELGHMHRSQKEPRHPINFFGVPALFEKSFGEAVEFAGEALFGHATPCGIASTAAGAGAMAGNVAAESAEGTPEGSKVAGLVKSLSTALGNFSLFLGAASGAGEC